MILSILLFFQLTVAQAQNSVTIPNQTMWEDDRSDAVEFVSHWGEFFVWKKTVAPESDSGPNSISVTKIQLELIKKRAACLKVYFKEEESLPEIDFCTIIMDFSEWTRWGNVLNDQVLAKDHNSKQEHFLQRAMNWLSRMTDVKRWSLEYNTSVQREQRLFELMTR